MFFRLAVVLAILELALQRIGELLIRCGKVEIRLVQRRSILGRLSLLPGLLGEFPVVPVIPPTVRHRTELASPGSIRSCSSIMLSHLSPEENFP